jgi:hypothetical protein
MVPPGMSGLFGYGSLLLRSSMERTLGRHYDGTPAVVTIRGWRRTWDSIYPNERFYFEQGSGARCYPANIIYLNIRRDPAATVNGLIYVVTDDDLRNFDQREAVYDRVRIDDDVVDGAVTGGPVYAYVGKPEFLLNPPVPATQAAIRRSYIAIVEEGLQELGPAFRREYEQSTEAVPSENVIDDRLEAR